MSGADRLRALVDHALQLCDVAGVDPYSVAATAYTFGGQQLSLWFSTERDVDAFSTVAALSPQDEGSETVYTRMHTHDDRGEFQGESLRISACTSRGRDGL